jgi:UDP-N-acetylglucosamine diphosphorylase/glucosamine-1-phosphate N-acetyltransferase
MSSNFAAIILAAGKGKRMKSELPKVLHRINGKPLIRHLMETISGVPLHRTVVVVGHKGELVIEELKDFDVEFVWQKEQRGTGHAVMVTEESFHGFEGTILVANGDVPFLSAASIKSLFEFHTSNNTSATCLSAELDNPKGYGRIVRQDKTDILAAIIEEDDADPEIRKIREINSGLFCFNSRDLFWALHQVTDENVQKEYYITDSIEILRKAGKRCAVWKVSDPLEVEGVNSLEQLSSLESAINAKKI